MVVGETHHFKGNTQIDANASADSPGCVQTSGRGVRGHTTGRIPSAGLGKCGFTMFCVQWTRNMEAHDI